MTFAECNTGLTELRLIAIRYQMPVYTVGALLSFTKHIGPVTQK